MIAADSAGGHLAVDLIAENHRMGVAQPGALVLFSPLADLTLGLSAERERDAPDPIISAAATGGSSTATPRRSLWIRRG